jgi:hypothetical protein
MLIEDITVLVLGPNILGHVGLYLKWDLIISKCIIVVVAWNGVSCYYYYYFLIAQIHFGLR